VDDENLAALGVDSFKDAKQTGAGGVQGRDGQAAGAAEAVVAGGF
jgi:hypothetical protein